MNAPEVNATPESMVSHFRSLQRVEELNESLENLNSARSSSQNTAALVVHKIQQKSTHQTSHDLNTQKNTQLNTYQREYEVQINNYVQHKD